MTKISKVKMSVLATRAMLEGKFKTESRINSILLRATEEDKRQGKYSNEVIIKEEESIIFLGNLIKKTLGRRPYAANTTTRP